MNARAQDKRVWLAGGAVLAVLILAVGWLAVISPQLSSARTLRGQSDSARAQNAVLATKVAKLKRQNDNVGQLRTSLRNALAALPFDSGLPTFTRQLADQASESGVALSSITVGTAAATVTTATAPTTTAAGSGTTAGTTTAAPAPAAAAPAAMVSIPVTLLSTGSNKGQLAFLKAIQVGGPRRALVISTNVGTGSTAGGASIDKSSTMTTQLTIFSTPLDASARAQLLALLRAK